MSETDEDFFAELERTAKALSIGASTPASHELRAVFDTIRPLNAAEMIDAPATAMDTLPVGNMRLVPALLSISKSTRALMQLKLAEAAFYNGQDELLLALEEEVPVFVSRLADKLSVRPSTVSKMLDLLVTKGLVDRRNDPRDARRTLVQITTAGLDARSLLLKMRETLEVELVASLQGSVGITAVVLESIAGLLRKRLNRLR